jgi:hypothetical protein
MCLIEIIARLMADSVSLNHIFTLMLVSSGAFQSPWNFGSFHCSFPLLGCGRFVVWQSMRVHRGGS